MAEGIGFEGVLTRARQGDGSAWGELYDRIAPLVVAYLRAQSLRDPDDVAGEVLLQVVRDLDRFEGDERAFRSWTLSIAHNRMLDARRAERRRPADPVAPDELDVTADTADPAALALAGEERREIDHHLAGLTADQREVVLLRVLGDLTLEETARVVGKRVGAVKALQHRAFAALRAQIAEARNSPALSDATQV